ncbi:hypothetical protein ABMA70_11295 [Halobacteriovorax sp. XZX-3]|uniref:hypothetical protein n=1 Tax=unclassified Halobacteriovorax TaxID=2639665 RepID=UPI000CD0CCD3|nr:hypothetical protein [Halobacteriovorax sp. DA5]POB13919.1 hypothetical protein C0Z22_07620 [Halobacteriovorax sp. DA5]
MSNIFWWIILICILIFATYAAFVIKGEKKVALKNAISFPFHGLEIPIPPWWTLTTDESELKIFERTDTRYEWQSRFSFTNKNYSDLQSAFEELAINNELVFDKDTTIIHEPKSFEKLYEQGIETLRVEGTATKGHELRVYYDAALLKTDDGIVILESESSVLNGLLEGPFFEQSLHNIKKK